MSDEPQDTSKSQPQPRSQPVADGLTERRRRSDAEQNYSRIIEAAVSLMRTDPAPSINHVAAAAGLGRATVYRHFAGRSELLEAARRHMLDVTATASTQEAPVGMEAPASNHLPTGGGGPDHQSEIADLLARVPPHLVGEQIVAEARRLPGVSSAALYVVDIDGSRLLRFAGSEEFPGELDAPLAVGPEIPLEGVANLRRMIADELPGTVASPLFLRGRATGLLLAVGATQSSLDDLAQLAAVAIYLAEGYTDTIAEARRRKPISAAGEIQQNLLPSRMMRVSGATIAGNVLPSYNVGGDWFDFAENADGTWLALADAAGRGETAASLAALALGAFRAARRSGTNLLQAAQSVHRAILAVNESHAVVTAVIGRWHGPTAAFSWMTCGQPGPILITAAGELLVLDAPDIGALGAAGNTPDWAPSTRQLVPGERLILYSDAIANRPTTNGTPFGLNGIRDAVTQAHQTSAAATVHAIEAAVTNASAKALEDDATLIVLAPTR